MQIFGIKKVTKINKRLLFLKKCTNFAALIKITPADLSISTTHPAQVGYKKITHHAKTHRIYRAG